MVPKRNSVRFIIRGKGEGGGEGKRGISTVVMVDRADDGEV